MAKRITQASRPTYFERLKKSNGKKCYVCGKAITISDGLNKSVHSGVCKTVYIGEVNRHRHEEELAKGK